METKSPPHGSLGELIQFVDTESGAWYPGRASKMLALSTITFIFQEASGMLSRGLSSGSVGMNRVRMGMNRAGLLTTQ